MPLGRRGVSNFAYTSLGKAKRVTAVGRVSGKGVSGNQIKEIGLRWDDFFLRWGTRTLLWS